MTLRCLDGTGLASAPRRPRSGYGASVSRAQQRPGYGEGRQALIDAAIRVVAASGLRGVTYRAVATEAGVTQGLVAHHFGTRADLIRATLDHAAGQSIERSELKPASGRVDDVARDLSKRVREDAGLEAFQFELALEARRNPDLAPAAKAIYERYLEATAEALDSVGVRASIDLARVVFAALDGLAFQQLLFDDPEATDRAIAALIGLLRPLAT